MALQSNGVVRRPEVGTGYRRARMADGGTFGMSIVLTFMTYCVEEYKAHKGLTGLQVEIVRAIWGVRLHRKVLRCFTHDGHRVYNE